MPRSQVLKKAKESLAPRLKTIPELPGVYLMRDSQGAVIYIGKAKNLKDRVRSYFSGHDERYQIEFLVKRIADIDTIVTADEGQAFILERDLIAKHMPRYNVRLKDDKAYLNIRIDTNHAWPRLELVRKIEDDGAQYFGPYSYSYELRNLLEIIKRVVPLRTCTDTVFYNRQRPCLEYQIKRCAGPCCLPVERVEYMQWVKAAMAILNGKVDGLARELREKMESASAELRFEDAAVYRDRLETLENTKSGLNYVSSGGEDRDVFALYREESLAAIVVLRVRNGRIFETSQFAFDQVHISDEEVLESVIWQFYGNKREVPEELITPFELPGQESLIKLLTDRRGASVQIAQPQRGLKSRLLELAGMNARQHFIASFELERRGVEISKELAKLLELKQIPRRIECIDISNLQGSDIVGAVVVFMDGVPDKPQYKRYRLALGGKPDDFAAIYEVTLRRLKRAMEEGSMPDLLLIDGGPGQLAKALQARDELRLSLEIIAIAKLRAAKQSVTAEQSRRQNERKPERLYIEGREEALKLDETHPVTHFLQRIRDEVHRYVITYHRARRAARVLASALDNIPGVGPERRRRLLLHFGSVRKLAEAPVQDLARAGKMPLALAQKVLSGIGAGKAKES